MNKERCMKCMTRLLEDHEDRQNNKVRCTKNEATAKKKMMLFWEAEEVENYDHVTLSLF